MGFTKPSKTVLEIVTAIRQNRARNSCFGYLGLQLLIDHFAGGFGDRQNRDELEFL